MPNKIRITYFCKYKYLNFGDQTICCKSVGAKRPPPPPTYNCYLTKGRITGTEKNDWCYSMFIIFLLLLYRLIREVLYLSYYIQSEIKPQPFLENVNMDSDWKKVLSMINSSVSIINILKLAILCLWHLQKFNKLRVLSNVHFHLK